MQPAVKRRVIAVSTLTRVPKMQYSVHGIFEVPPHMTPPRSALTLFAALVATCACAQEPPPIAPENLPPPVEMAPAWDSPGTPLLDNEFQEGLVAAAVETDSTCDVTKSLANFWGYRYESNMSEWIIGDGNQFGMFSLDWNHYRSVGYESGLGFGMAFRFLGGPERTDLPPRMYNFSIAYQTRDSVGALSYDVAFSVMAASDFEGSSREGIRYPAHAVGFLSISDFAELVFGADYLDRDDVRLLPVGGLIWRPHPNVRLEAIFPSPKAYFQLTEKQRLFLNGSLGGGTWAVERDTLVDDLFTYHDLRVGIGLEHVKEDGDWSAIEIAYLFDRKLEFASHNGDYRPDGTLMIGIYSSY